MQARILTVAAASLLILTTHRVLALTVPVAQDANSTTTNQITTVAGKATSVAVNSKQTGFFRFDLSKLNIVPGNINSVSSAMLRLYVITSTKPADLSVHAATQDFTEAPVPTPAVAPLIDPAVIATIPAADLLAKHFISVDVTAAVQAALNGGADLAFAIQTADPSTKITFGSKEGPGTSYSAELEIVAQAANSIANADIATGAGIDASKLGTGLVSNTEFNFLNNVTSSIQTQLNNRLQLSGGTLTGSLTADSFKIPARTFVMQITANEFVVDSPAENYNRGSGLIYPAGGDTQLILEAGVHLPDGATVTKLKPVFFDSSATEDIVDTDVRLEYFTTTNPSLVTMANILQLGSNGFAGGLFAPFQTTSIVDAVIDNSARAYVVTVVLKVTNTTSDLRFYGVRIEYTLDSLLP
jgi:hypothetical protein